MAKKLLNIIDKNDKIIGIDTCDNVHNYGFLHREIQIWVYNKKGDVLLRKRSRSKKIFPGFFDDFIGGHVGNEEDYVAAAQREVFEEAGLKVKKQQLELIATIKSNDTDPVSGKQNDFFRKIYALEYNGNIKKLKKDKKETDCFCFMSFDELLAISKKDRNEYVSIFWKKEYCKALKKIMKLFKNQQSDVLAICSSGRGENSNTEWILKEMKKILKKNGVSAEILFLNDCIIEDCKGCGICRFLNKPCKIKDDMQLICKKIEDAKCLIIGSPNYFKNVSGAMKRFIDRTNSFIQYNKETGKTIKKLLLKPVVGICVGGEEFEDIQYCEDAMVRFFKAHGFNIIGKLKAQADAPLEIVKNKIIRKQLLKESQKIIKAIK